MPRRPSPATTSMIEENIAAAGEIITKWDLNGSAYSKITSLFYESREEAHAFIAAVIDLKRAMQSLVDNPTTNTSTRSKLLSHAQHLMVTAMARLNKELYQILITSSRNYLDYDSLSSTGSTISSTNNSVHSNSTSEDGDPSEEKRFMARHVMADLRSIVTCMVQCGYSKECSKMYTAARRSVVEEGLDHLGHVRQSSSKVQKLKWEDAEKLIKNWVAGSRSAVRTLFAGEQYLCDYVFGSARSIKDHIFTEIIKEPAVQFLRFPELVASKMKSSPEKIFHYLDLYESISELYLEIESLFSHQSTIGVPSQARTSLVKLAGFIRSSLDDFEKAIEKDWTKGTVAGGGVHPLTRYVMNYLSFLADYNEMLGDIVADHPRFPSKPLPEPFIKLLTPVPSAPSSPRFQDALVFDAPPVLCSRVAWLILLLLCKLDKKAEMYKEAPLSYLFLTNNMRYVVNKVRTSNLRHLLGEEWVKKNSEKARSFARSYERLGWMKVVEALPANPTAFAERGGVEAVVEKMVAFNGAFEEVYRRQSGWVVADTWLREDLKASIAGKVVGPYRDLYEVCVTKMREEMSYAESFGVVRFTPEDVGNYLSDLFCEGSGSRSGSTRSCGTESGYRSSDGSSKAGRFRSA